MTTNTTITLPPGTRRTRCPKCTTLHTEPSAAVYKCSTCSTLLLARHRSTQAKNASMDSRGHGLGINLKHVRPPDGEFKCEDMTNASSNGTDENQASGRSNIKIGSYGIDEGNIFDRHKEGISWQNVYEHKNALLEKPYEGNPKEFQTNHSSPSLHRRSSYSSIASTGSSGNHLGRHFSGIGSASFTGSETGVFSPLWSSVENMDIPEADLLIENSTVLNNNNHHDTICSHVVDSKDGIFNHTRRHDENAWLSQLADASESHADKRTNIRRRLDLKDDNDDNDGDDDYDPRKLVSSFSRLPCSDTNSKYCINNVTELSFRIGSVNNVCPSLVEDMGVSKKKGYYLSGLIVSGSEQSSNLGIDDSKANDMNVKLIDDAVVNEDSWRKSCRKSTSEAGKEKSLCQFNKCNGSKDLCIDQGIPYDQNGKTYKHDIQKSSLRMSQSQGNASHPRGSDMNYSGYLLNQDANSMPRTFSHQIHSMNATNDKGQSCEMTDNSILQGHCSDSSKFPCEKLNIMHRNGYTMPLPTSHKNYFSPNEQCKQISELSSMAQDDYDDNDHYRHCQYRSNIPVKQNQVEYCHMKRMGNLTLFQIKERMYPPFPGPGASPYVLCRYCCKILQVPTHLHVRDALQKLKCSACGKTSKFNVVGRDKNPPTFRKVSKKDEQILAPQPNYVFQEPHKIHGFDEGLAQNGHSSFYTHGANQFYSGSNLQREKLDRSKDGILFGFHKSSEPECEMGSGPTTSILEARGVFDRHLRHGEYDGDGMQRNVSGAINGAYVPSPSFNSSNSRSIPVGSFDTDGSHDLTRHDIMKDDMAMGFGFPSHSSSLKQKANGFTYKESDEAMVRTHLREMHGFDGCSYTTKNPSESIETTETEKRSIISDTIPRAKSEALAVPPGSPLIEHFFNDSSHIASIQDLIDVIRAPEDDNDSSICSPAPGSPLFRHLSYDSMFDLNKKNTNHDHKIRNVDNIVNAPNDETSFRGVSKGPKDLARLLRKGISELGKVGQTHGNRQKKVVVNGHIIPDTALKRVETRAGLMHPGTYWYDYRAGFWGVMGGPCLGIVPPFIEELNFPLARDCSGGDTSILVNGRELHEEDLLVLSNRGLPTTQGKSYTIDINGHVVDTNTSEQALQCRLGRLAPSMERRGRGYGMFQPSLQC